MLKRSHSSLPLADWLYATGVEATFHNWSSRRKLTRAVLVVLILMNLRTFEYFPGFRAVQDAWYGLTLLSFMIMYPLLKIALDWTFTRVEFYLLAVLPVLFILPALTANQVFGQPIFYGIFPQRSAIPVLWWLLLINAWKLGWVRASDLKAAFLFNIWGTFLLFNAMRLLLNPAKYPYVGFIVGGGSDASFTLSAYFAVFGFFYYSFEAFRQRRVILYLPAAINFLSGLGHSGRSLAVSVLLAAAICCYAWRGPVPVAKVVTSFALVLVAFLALSYTINPTSTLERVQKFADAFRVVTGASEVSDVSANARILETETAKPLIRQHPILGLGSVSLQWEGGLVAAVGEYFVPGDIGFVGIMFTYGAFGLIVFSAQYLFASRYVSGAVAVPPTPLMDATRGFVLFTALYSAVTGLFVFNIETTSLFVVLVTLLGTPQKHLDPSRSSESLPALYTPSELARV